MALTPGQIETATKRRSKMQVLRTPLLACSSLRFQFAHESAALVAAPGKGFRRLGEVAALGDAWWRQLAATNCRASNQRTTKSRDILISFSRL